MQRIEHSGKHLLRWERGASTFIAWPEGGARLMNWNLTYPDGTLRDLLYWPQAESLDDIGSIRGGNPILFPFCGRSFDDGEIDRWRTPEDERRPMPLHGFARDRRFEIRHLSETGFSARLIPAEADFDAYPYSYEFIVSYRFEELALSVELSLKNLDTKPIPWSAGHHFYFTLPWSEGLSREDYRLRISAKEAYRYNRGELVPLPEFPSEDTFGNPALCDRIHSRLKNHAIDIREAGGSGSIEICVGNGRPHPAYTIVTWSESETAPFYCVEPWMGPPGAAKHQFGIHMVDPGKSESFIVDVKIK